MKIFLLKFINYSKCFMISNKRKIKNKVRFYVFLINTKNEMLTILKNEKNSKYKKIFKKKNFFLIKFINNLKSKMVGNERKNKI